MCSHPDKYLLNSIKLILRLCALTILNSAIKKALLNSLLLSTMFNFRFTPNPLIIISRSFKARSQKKLSLQYVSITSGKLRFSAKQYFNFSIITMMNMPQSCLLFFGHFHFMHIATMANVQNAWKIKNRIKLVRNKIFSKSMNEPINITKNAAKAHAIVVHVRFDCSTRWISCTCERHSENSLVSSVAFGASTQYITPI